MVLIMRINQDFLEFIRLLNLNKVKYIIVGAYALSFYGRPRFTGDIDILISTKPENAARMIKVLEAFGMGSLGLKQIDFETPGQIIQLGVAPRRIDIMTEITGVDFERAWLNKVEASLEGETVYYLGKEDYIANKKATGRARDLSDIEEIQ